MARRFRRTIHASGYYEQTRRFAASGVQCDIGYASGMSGKKRRRSPQPPTSPATPPGQQLTHPADQRRSNSIRVLAGIAAVLLLGAVIWSSLHRAPAPDLELAGAPQPASAASPAAQFVDESECQGCHAEQFRLWAGSHHRLAMQEASESSVLGDFSDSTFTKDGVTSRFFRRDGRFYVNTDGPDGELANFEVKYTFGVQPLQQYLIPLSDGRLQALSIAWDTQRRRWLHLYPEERVDHRDELHWTRPSQNWNFMCAECHSTDVRKRFDATSGTYHTTFERVDVGCQACHGPGSRHLERQKSGGLQPVGVQQPLVGEFDVDLARGGPAAQIEVCARCHSRRAQVWEDFKHGKPLMDTHLPALLSESLYHADGQIEGEVYEYGSFLQSRMYARGVRCTDCHEPHSAGLRADGNAVCTACHNDVAPQLRHAVDVRGLQVKRYDSAEHHFHAVGKPGSQCVDCHMPERVYMQVDGRRDHSIRIPRPDLSAKMGTPNACTACHQDKEAAWAAKAMEQWYGPRADRPATYGETLWAGRTGQPGAMRALAGLIHDRTQPDIARATAVELLGRYPSQHSIDLAIQALTDSDPLVRHAALGVIELLPPEQRGRFAGTVLEDPVRSVRMEAARILAPAPGEGFMRDQRSRLRAAITEYETSQSQNADRPESYLNLGNLYTALRDFPRADSAYQAAVRLDARFVPAYANLAELHSLTGHDELAVAVLRDGLTAAPGNAVLLHALGLALVRQKKYEEALRHLRDAARREPSSARFAYVFGVALHERGRVVEAVRTLESALERHPTDRDLLAALVAYLREQGQEDRASALARRLENVTY